jgi:hypothetical protein
MQMSAVRALPDSGVWTSEAKLDGYRCLAAKRAAVLCFGPAAGRVSLFGFQRSRERAKSCQWTR